MEELEELLKVLADKNRLRMIKLLEERKMCVCELAFILGITQPSVSKHLKKLNQAGLVGSEQDGFWTNYYLKSGNKLSKTTLPCIKKYLNNDSIVKEDLEKLKKVNRTRLCCKK